MNEEQKGKLALIFLKLKLKEDGIVINENIKKEVDELAVRAGIDPKESVEFIEILTQEILDEIFAPYLEDLKHTISSS